MKKNFNPKIMLALLMGVFIYSCQTAEIAPENRQDKINESMINGEIIGSTSFARIVTTTCDVTGSTTASPGQTKNYSYTSNIPGASIVWSVTGAITRLSPQGSNPSSFKFGNNFSGGSIRAIGSNGEVCSDTKFISSTGGSTCQCPAPEIDDVLCVSGGHPYWRFQLNNVSSSDDIRWYAQHASIMAGQGTDYVIVNPSSSATGGFTLYCEVTKTCSNGSTKVRTAYYSNYYGGSCGNGSTGFTGTCSSGGGWLD